MSSGTTSFLLLFVIQMCVSPRLCTVSIENNGSSSSSGSFSFPLVDKRESMSAAWCLIPTLLTTSNKNFVSRRRQRASLPVFSVRFRICFSE